LDGYDSILHNNWLDIPGVVIIHPFCSKPGMVSEKIPEGIFLQLYFYTHFKKGKRRKTSLALGQKLVLGKPSNYVQVSEVVSPPIPILRFTQRDLQYL
jgi:hypothetical protein